VIAIEGNKIRLSRKAVLRDQKGKAGPKHDQHPHREHPEKN